MMNHFLSPKREMIQKNGSIHKDNCYNEISRKYQSLGVNSETLQDMKHRSKNYPHLINFMQGINFYEFSYSYKVHKSCVEDK